MSGHDCNIELLFHTSDFEWFVTVKLEDGNYTQNVASFSTRQLFCSRKWISLPPDCF